MKQSPVNPNGARSQHNTSTHVPKDSSNEVETCKAAQVKSNKCPPASTPNKKKREGSAITANMKLHQDSDNTEKGTTVERTNDIRELNTEKSDNVDKNDTAGNDHIQILQEGQLKTERSQNESSNHGGVLDLMSFDFSIRSFHVQVSSRAKCGYSVKGWQEKTAAFLNSEMSFKGKKGVAQTSSLLDAHPKLRKRELPQDANTRSSARSNDTNYKHPSFTSDKYIGKMKHCNSTASDDVISACRRKTHSIMNEKLSNKSFGHKTDRFNFSSMKSSNAFETDSVASNRYREKTYKTLEMALSICSVPDKGM